MVERYILFVKIANVNTPFFGKCKAFKIKKDYYGKPGTRCRRLLEQNRRWVGLKLRKINQLAVGEVCPIR